MVTMMINGARRCYMH